MLSNATARTSLPLIVRPSPRSSGVSSRRASRSSNASSTDSAPAANPQVSRWAVHAAKKRWSERSPLTSCSSAAWNGWFSQTSPSTGESSTTARVRPGNRLVYVSPSMPPHERPHVVEPLVADRGSQHVHVARRVGRGQAREEVAVAVRAQLRQRPAMLEQRGQVERVRRHRLERRSEVVAVDGRLAALRRRADRSRSSRTWGGIRTRPVAPRGRSRRPSRPGPPGFRNSDPIRCS